MPGDTRKYTNSGAEAEAGPMDCLQKTVSLFPLQWRETNRNRIGERAQTLAITLARKREKIAYS